MNLGMMEFIKKFITVPILIIINQSYTTAYSI